MIPIFEALLKPKKDNLNLYRIERISVRGQADSLDEFLSILEAEFPTYDIEHTISGYRQGRKDK